jgi:hypothetical protein
MGEAQLCPLGLNHIYIMGILADFYVSRDDEAVKCDTAPDQFADRAQFKRITSLELSMLWAIMGGIEWDVAVMDDFSLSLGEDEGERVIQGFPDEMTKALEKLSPGQIRDLSVKWAATEEMACPPENIRPAVEALVRLARVAVGSNRKLYVWNCV